MLGNLLAKIRVVLIELALLSNLCTANEKCVLPEGCKYVGTTNIKDFHLLITVSNMVWGNVNNIVCEGYGTSFKFKSEMTDNCHYEGDNDLIVYVKPDNEKISILSDSNFKLFDILKLIDNSQNAKFAFSNIDGINVESNFNIEWSSCNFSEFLDFFGSSPCDHQIFLEFNEINFDFYDATNKNLIRSCDELSNSTEFVFKLASGVTSIINLNKVKFINPVCPLVFRNARISSIRVRGLIDSFYKKNVLTFMNSTREEEINSSIGWLYLDDCYHVDFDSTFLDGQVFKKLHDLEITSGYLNSIQVDLFKSFKSIRDLAIEPHILRDIILKQGISWMASLNEEINLKNTSDPVQVEENAENIKFIWTTFSEDFNREKLQIAYDEDFCLFKDFPFEKLIVFKYHFYTDDNFQYSCPLLWLSWNYRIIYEPIQAYWFYNSITIPKMVNSSSAIARCDFQRRLDNCNKINLDIVPNKEHSEWTQYDSIILADILLPILSVVIAIIGIVLNYLVVYVVTHKKNQKELKEKQYKYMSINSVCAICILFIQIFDLMTECQEPFGLYCSQIHKLVVIQYYKIIFSEFFSFFFQLMTNFTYVAFSLNRLSLIGTEQSRITMCVSEMAIKYFILVSVFLSALFSVIKGFRYEVNYYVPNHDYPFAFQNNPFYNPSNEITDLIFITNGIVDFINYILFILVNLIIDILLVLNLKKTLKEKREKFAQLGDMKEDEEVVTRLIRMAIFYALTSLIFKLPNSITSLNDFIIILSNFQNFQNFYQNINVRYFDFLYFTKYVCSVTKICQVFHKYANFFYLISLSFNILFFYNFDKKFNAAYNLVCGIMSPKVSPKLKRQQTTKPNIVI